MHRTVIATIVAVLGLAAQAHAETLENFKKQVAAKVSAYKSLQYKSHITSDMSSAQMSYKMTSDQTAEYKKEGEKVLYHIESKTNTQQKIGEMSQNTNITSLDVSDGTLAYNYSDAGGQKSASKRKIDPKTQPSPFDAAAGFKMMEQYYNLKLLPDETVDGKSCYVLEMTLKDKQAGIPIGKSKLYYDKGTGIAIKSISYDDKDKQSGTMTTTDLKIDGNIPADHFVFKVPVGVEIKDDTKGS
jgi:outer membrane lipoprotein-sorting protein